MTKRPRASEDDVKRAVELVACKVPRHEDVAGLTLTPLERQVVAMREELPAHVILLVACGYRVKFYGRDSQVVSRRCGIMCIPAQPFVYSSVPYQRAGLYMRRLVAMGYHVAFADQESAAVRAVDGVKSGIFTRTVSQYCSRGTVLPDEPLGPQQVNATTASGGIGGGNSGEAEEDEQGGNDDLADNNADGDNGGDVVVENSSQQFMCFIMGRRKSQSGGSDGGGAEVVLVSFVTCVCLHVVLESSLQLEDLIRLYDIVEVVFVTAAAAGAAAGAPPPTKPSSYGSSNSSSGKTGITHQCLSSLPEAFATVLNNTLALNFGPTENGEEDSKTVATAQFAARIEDAGLAGTVERYLKPYKLDTLFHRMPKSAVPCLDKPNRPFSAQSSTTPTTATISTTSSASLPGSTLRALDLFHSSIGPGGALISLLTQGIVTPGGARTLRAWVAAPLADARAIQARQDAVTFILLGKDEGTVEELLREAGKAGDADALLGKLEAQRCPVGEYVRFLRVANAVHLLSRSASGVCGASTPLLHSLLADLAGEATAAFMSAHDAEMRSSASTPLELLTSRRDCVPGELQAHMVARDTALAELEAELVSVRATLQLPGLEYRTVSGTPYVLDLPNSAKVLQRVPAGWTVLSRTKGNVRYHTPGILAANTRLCAARERLAAAAASAWAARQLEMVSDAEQLAVLRCWLRCVAELDALYALSRAAARPGYVAPTIVGGDSGDGIAIKDGRHPVLDATLKKGYVCCDVTIARGGVWLLTGPNMGGKSAFMRMVGLFSVLAQVGAYVPAAKATLPVFTGVYCRMGATDSILEGASTFLMEMEETSRILRAPSLASALVLMDELGRGTSSFDGVAVAAASLDFLVAKRATTVFVTHYNSLCEPYLRDTEKKADDDASRVQCHFMGFAKKDGQLVFSYKPQTGVTPSSFGVSVARLAGLPAEVTDLAESVSKSEEAAQEERHAVLKLKSFLGSGA